MKFEAFDWYEDVLCYDMIFDADSPQEADFLEEIIARYVRTSGKPRRVLEPACGSGRLVTELAARSYDVTGFDISPDMLSFARQRLDDAGLAAVLTEDRMESFRAEDQFDLAHCLVSTFRYLQDEEAAVAHLHSVARALKPGGVYVLGLHISDYHDRATTRERWEASRDGTHVVCTIQGWPANRRRRTERVRARFVVTENDGPPRRLETEWTFRTYSLRQLRSTLRAVPEFEHVATFNFQYLIDEPIELDGGYLDNVLILRRRD